MSDHFPPDDLRSALDVLRTTNPAADPPGTVAALETVIRIVLEHVQSTAAHTIVGPFGSLESRVDAVEEQMARLKEDIVHRLVQRRRAP